jgi:predicted aspartyl protease
VPFDNVYGVVVIRVLVDGRGPYDFALDTGAGSMVVTPDLARELELPREGQTALSGSGAGPSLRTETTVLESVSVGGLTERNLDAVELALPDGLAHRVPGTSVRGLIGCDFLKRFATTIDYATLTLTFGKPGNERAGIALPMVMAMGGARPAIRAEFDGHRGTFLLDTGNSGWPVMTHAFAEKSGLEKAYGAGLPTVSGAAGGQTASYRQVCMHRFSMGGSWGMGPFPVNIDAEDYGLARWPDLDGNIGYEMMRRARTTFDFADKVVYVEPVPVDPAPDYATTRGCLPQERYERRTDGAR